MTRDELNKALKYKLDVENKDGKQFRIITTGSYQGQEKVFTFLVFFKKIKGQKLGRVRSMDITTFTKTHKIVKC